VIATERGGRFTTLLAACAFLVSGYGFWTQWQEGAAVQLGLLTFDPFGNFLCLLLAATGLIVVLYSYRYWRNQEEFIAEGTPLLLFAVSGMTLMVSTTHLLTFVLGLEVMSLSLYVMVGMRRHDPASGEAALKYFILGSVAAAFLLLGISFLYGSTGTLSAELMGRVVVTGENAFLFKAGALLVLLGFAFKVAAVPLHFWAPDAYEGAPVPVTGFMAVAVKVAAFGALIRVVQAFAGWEGLSLTELFIALSLLTMVVGNLTALRQRSLKRIMAYSSIAHAGYLLLGVATLVRGAEFRMESLSPLLFYLLVYGLLTLGAFAVLTALSSGGKEIGELKELDGLAASRPLLSAALSIFLISLAGIPPSAGFFAKYYLFAQAVHVGLYPLAVVGILSSVASLYYYLGPVVRMYFHKSGTAPQFPALGVGMKCLIALLVLGVFYFGLFPGRALEITQKTLPFAVSTSTATGVVQ
jgi:NADH-quinone oxidoreductase subunit N